MSSPTPEVSYGIAEVPFCEEVDQVMQDIRFGVDDVRMSKVLPTTPITTFINMRFKEGREVCILMSPQGFRIVGNKYDTQNENGPCYETLNALLDSESPAYRSAFSELLTERLKNLPPSPTPQYPK